MAITITSFTPNAGYPGTIVAVTGTNLNTAVSVLVAGVPAPIIGTPTNTALNFQIPQNAGYPLTTASVAITDNSGASVVAGSTLNVSAIPATEALVTTPARKWRCDVLIGATWTKVRGVTNFQPSVATTTQDDSDYDSGFWGSDAKTRGKWQLVLTVKRGQGAVSGNYDPGQQALLAAHDQTGPAGSVTVRWYDRLGGVEAYTGTALVQWSDQGGASDALDFAQVTLTGQGARTQITNPVLANQSLTA